MHDFKYWLRELAQVNGSDMHLKAGRPPLFRICSDLIPTKFPILNAQDISDILQDIMTTQQWQTFCEHHEIDFALEIPELARFRINAFHQRHCPGAVFRLVPFHIPSFTDLGLPESLRNIADHTNGLVLLAGPTGCGKSTTLAAMVRHINETRSVHIITVEDPIEYLHTDCCALINQRELGIDTGTLQDTLRSLLRQDPDIILMGEMRDPETIQFGITAAETGHLVFATVHTNDAPQAIERILDTMPRDSRDQIRTQLARLLRAVISQRLVRKLDNTGMAATLEILINTQTVAKLLTDNKIHEAHKAMEDGAYYGMITFNQHLYELASSKVISQETALACSDYPSDLQLMFQGVKKGVSVTSSPLRSSALNKGRSGV